MHPRIRALTLSPLLAVAIVLSLPALAADTDTTPAANQANADFATGRKAIENKDWAAAAATFERVVQRDSRNADAYNLLGYAYRWQGKMNESFAAYNKALTLDPTHRGAHELGVLERGLG